MKRLETYNRINRLSTSRLRVRQQQKQQQQQQQQKQQQHQQQQQQQQRQDHAASARVGRWAVQVQPQTPTTALMGRVRSGRVRATRPDPKKV